MIKSKASLLIKKVRKEEPKRMLDTFLVSGLIEARSHERMNLLALNTPDIELKNIGSPMEVGERLINDLLASDEGGREAELIEANSRDIDGRVFYDIEYVIHLTQKDRHELATVIVDQGSLYTFVAGTNEARWNKVEDLFRRVISSFIFFI